MRCTVSTVLAIDPMYTDSTFTRSTSPVLAPLETSPIIDTGIPVALLSHTHSRTLLALLSCPHRTITIHTYAYDLTICDSLLRMCSTSVCISFPHPNFSQPLPR